MNRFVSKFCHVRVSTMDYFVNQRPKQYSKCCLLDCESHTLRNKDNLSFFTFPADPFRLAVWISNSKCDKLRTIPDLAGNTKYRLCSLHFETIMFANFQKNRLYGDAVPTLFDNNDTQHVDESVTNTD